MQYLYSLDANDFLELQLFAASKNQPMSRKINKSRWIITILFVTSGALALYFKQPVSGYGFMILALAVIFFYPGFIKNRYRKHYLNYINQAYKERINEAITVTISEHNILSTTKAGRMDILLTQITAITETLKYVFIQLDNGQYILFPKEKITNTEVLLKELQDISRARNIPYSNKPDWKW